MTRFDISPVPALTWPDRYGTDPGLTLEEVVRPHGEKATVSFLNGSSYGASVTYDELARRIATAANRLRANGVRAGDPVAMTLTNDLPAVVAALGIWAAGGTLVSVPPPPRKGQQLHAQRFGAVLTAMDCRHYLTSDTPNAATEKMHRVPIVALQGDDDSRDPEPAIPDHALVQFTSGSLGTPKGVAISARAFAGHIKMISRCFDLDPTHDKVATWLPLYHDLGFVCFFGSALYSRTAQVHADPRAFVLDPSSWMRMLADEQATITGAPNFGFRLAARVPYPCDLDLSRVRCCLNAAERVIWSDIEDFHRVTGPLGFRWEALQPAYGLAEGTVGVSCTVRGRGPTVSPDGHVSLGPPLPGNRYTIVGDETPGTLHLDGDWLFDGYWTESGFQPRPAGPYDTGDAAFERDGHVYVIGRHADVASIGGHNVFAEDVEAVALGVGSESLLGAAAYKYSSATEGERFALVLEVSPRNRDEAAQLAKTVRGAVADAVNTRVSPLLVVQRGVIPRTTSGKPQRRALREAIHAGEIPARRIFAEL
ncbi:MAG TPA: AMP-binding protein [Micromonospora sp.]